MNILSNFSLEKCCGCGACINTCPVGALEYGTDKYGFIVPKINMDLCINCGKCIKVCPYNQERVNNKATQLSYAAINNNHEIAINSSSGGIFGAIAINILNSGGVVYGCELTKDLKSQHCRIESLKDVYRVMRSKYIQSFMGDTFIHVKNDLKDGKTVLFSGTPCQIAGLRSFLGKVADYPNLYLVDIVCHGVPSQKLFDSYREYLEQKKGKAIESYTFRYKKKYFNGMKWYSSYKLVDGKRFVHNWPEDSYSYYYMNAYTNRDSCYKCPFASLSRQSDITLCDYWHWDECNVCFKNGSSVSAVVVNSEKGKKLFAETSKQLEVKETSLQSIVKFNGCISHPVEKPQGREDVLSLWLSSGYESLDNQFTKRNKLDIIKYRILRNIPDFILNLRK